MFRRLDIPIVIEIEEWENQGFNYKIISKVLYYSKMIKAIKKINLKRKRNQVGVVDI